MRTKIILIVGLIFINSFSSAEETKAKLSGFKKVEEGILLEAPVGRQLVDAQPLVFKWLVTRSDIKSISLRIYSNNDQSNNPAIASFELNSKIRSVKLSNSILAEGSYYWEVHGFNDSDPLPQTTGKSYFTIEPQQLLNLKTKRIVTSFSTSRGEYSSQDPNYSLNFDTTPVTFGLGFSGGSNNSIYEITYSFSDITIRGSLKKIQSVKAHYSWRILGNNPYSFELFIGPQLRTVSYPLINTADGLNLTSETNNSLNAGINISLQSQLSENASFFLSAFLDNAIGSSNELSDLSYEIRLGGLYNIRWPVGFGVDLSYYSDTVSSEVNVGLLKATNNAVSLTGKFFYSF